MAKSSDIPASDAPIVELNALGLLCPEPIVRASGLLRGLKSGQELQVDADDPLAELDFRVFCDQTGHQLVSVEALPPSGWRLLIRCR